MPTQTTVAGTYLSTTPYYSYEALRAYENTYAHGGNSGYLWSAALPLITIRAYDTFAQVLKGYTRLNDYNRNVFSSFLEDWTGNSSVSASLRKDPVKIQFSVLLFADQSASVSDWDSLKYNSAGTGTAPLAFSPGSSFVSDTPSNFISAYASGNVNGTLNLLIGWLNGKAANPVYEIADASGTSLMTAAQATTLSAALPNISVRVGTTAIVKDSAVNLVNFLNAVAADEILGGGVKIALADGAGPVSAAQAVVMLADRDSFASGQLLAISDTPQAISTHLSALKAGVLKISSISVTGEVPLTYTQFIESSDVFAKFVGTPSFKVQGVTVGNVGTLNANTTVSSIEVVDTAATVQSNLASLRSAQGKISAITLTDAGAARLSLTITQINDSATVLETLADDGVINASGSGAQVASSIAQLGRLADQIQSITLSDVATPLALSAEQLASNVSVINKIAGSFSLAITDQAGDVSLNLAALSANVSKISSITITDIASTPLVIEYAERDTFSTLAEKINWPSGEGWQSRIVLVEGVTLAQAQALVDLSVSGRYQVKVSIVDTAANLENGAALLQSLSVDQDAIAEIALLDSAVAMDYQVYRSVDSISGGLVNVLNVAASDAQAVLLDAGVQGITLRDTAANLSALLPSLIGQEEKIQSIELSDSGNISIVVPSNTSAVTTLYNLRGLISKFAVGYGINMDGVSPYELDQILRNNSDVVSIAVQGSSNSLGQMLTQIHSWGSRIESIEITDVGPVIDISATQLLNQASTLNKMSGSFTYRVFVDHTNFDAALLAQSEAFGGRVSSIWPSGSDFVRISLADFDTYSATLAKVNNGTRFYLQGLSVEEALENGSDPLVWGVQITDTAANLSASFDDLQTLANTRTGFYAITITQSDAGSPLELNAAQATAYGPLLSRIATPVTIKVVDTSSNISARLEGLYGQRARISEVVVSDGLTVPVTLAVSELNEYSAQLNQFTGNYSFKLTYATATQAVNLASDPRFSAFEVWDNVTNISANLDRLLALGDKLSAVRYTHSSLNPLQIKEEEIELYRSVLTKFVNGYSLDVVKVNAGSAASLLSQSGINRISVEDTASNIVTHLDSLIANTGRIKDISIVDSSSMILSGTIAYRHAYMLSNWVLLNSPASLVITIVDTTMAQLSNLRSYFPTAKFQIVDTSNSVAENFYQFAWYGDSINQVSLTDNVSILSMSASRAAEYKPYIDKFVGNIKVSISDFAFNVNQVLSSLIELGSRLETINFIGSSSALSMNIDTFVNASSTLAKISRLYSVALTGTQAQFIQQMNSLSLQAEKIDSIHLVGDKSWSGSVSEARRYASLLAKTNIDEINLIDTASQLSYLDLSGVASRKITLTPTALDNNIVLTSNESLDSIDLSRLVGASFVATPINNGYGVSIQVTQNGVVRTFTILNEVFNDLVIKGYKAKSDVQSSPVNESATVDEGSPTTPSLENANSTIFAIPIENIDAIGISPDGRYLIIKSSGLSRMISIGDTLEFSNAKMSGDQISAQISPTPVFSSFVNGVTSYVLPDLFTGPASLGLKYQLIDSTVNAIVTGSNDNDFIKVADANSLGKAVNGGGGNDVIDGGVGSTFISGGGGTNIFFLDGRAPGVSWSTITDFQLGQDKVTIWGWKQGVSKVAFVDNFGGAIGYDGLTLHFENLLPSNAGADATNSTWNSITLSGRNLSDLGAKSLDDLNAQILNGSNPFLITSQTVDDFGTHGYLHIS